MNSFLKVPLNTSPEQTVRLQELQTAFAEVCNALAPVVQQTRCWNRVTLHHLAYHALRERFPKIGSQMVCNAIYSVSRTCRLVLQHPGSPWNVGKHPERALPLLKFMAKSPVYFDRHTLSLKDGQLSMYTLDGRMRFQLDLQPADQARFHREKLREIVLSDTGSGFQLAFWFSAQADSEDPKNIPMESSAELPEYLIVLPDTVSAAGHDEQPTTVPSRAVAHQGDPEQPPIVLAPVHS